jgi:hypothetical protein
VDLRLSAKQFARSAAVAILMLVGIVIFSSASPAAAAARCPRVTFHSVPKLKAQRACENLGVTTHGTDPGTYLFLTQNGASGAGAGIFQDDGTLVWWLGTGARKDHDMTVVRYQGQPYIALWTGRAPAAGSYGVGSITLYDQHYNVAGHISISRAYGANGIDLHEFQITPAGNALVGSYTPVRMRVSGHWETVLGYLVEKWSLVRDASGIHTSRLLFKWNALTDVRLSDSHVPDPGADRVWDYFHGNGIAEAPDGNLLVSARNTWGIYEINDHPGTRGFDHVSWQVGAKHDSRLAEPWCFQHDIAALGHGVYSLYDNGGSGPGCMPGSTQHAARGLVFSVDTSRRPARVRLIRAYTHRPPIYTAFTGSTQILDNGDSLIDWANVPRITEFDSSGRQVKMDLSLSGWSYRGFRFAWDGQPAQPPALAAQRTTSGTNAWASWNGSTEVGAWQLLGGPDANHLAPVGAPVAKTGFETPISVSGHYATLAVQALNSQGSALMTSRPISG